MITAYMCGNQIKGNIMHAHTKSNFSTRKPRVCHENTCKNLHAQEPTTYTYIPWEVPPQMQQCAVQLEREHLVTVQLEQIFKEDDWLEHLSVAQYLHACIPSCSTPYLKCHMLSSPQMSVVSWVGSSCIQYEVLCVPLHSILLDSCVGVPQNTPLLET